jgi:hypothetical protein
MYLELKNIVNMKIRVVNLLIACICLFSCQKSTFSPDIKSSKVSADGPSLNSSLSIAFQVVVRLHPDETYFPMNPLEFISKSRFRHERSGSDEGYNKLSNRFERTNSHDAEYYNIPATVLNSYGLQNGTKNRRPRDDNRGDYNVFLEPDDNLAGNSQPSNLVPVYSYALNNKIQYWLFYGYNYSNVGGVSFSHQGDWESVTLDLLNNKIVGAWLSAHGEDKYYSKSELEIDSTSTNQILYVYSAKGTHAMYNHPGDYHILNTDHASGGGSEWSIMGNVLTLSSQPWKDYAGAWGEVGEQAATTGPLGPWYKKIQ